MYCHDTTDPVLFDPRTGTKVFPVASGSSQGCMNGTLLEDGSVVLAGGQDGEDPGAFRNAVRWVKRFDSVLGTWQRLPDLVHPAGRWYTGLARLADGSLLVMGGGTAPNAERTATCERMDLGTRTWSYTGSLVNPAEFPPSGLLMNGKVLATWWPPQVYDPSIGQWRATGNFNQPNRGWPGHSDHSLVILENGRGLVLGIRGKQQGNTVMGELYDPATETWSLTTNPDLVRFQSEVVPLPDGRILVAAGETEANPAPVPTVLGIVRWCDLYTPVSNSWRRVADMPSFREYHAVTVLLPDGRVATTGGTRIKFQVGPTTADIEAFRPPYLYRGVRPRITFISNLSPVRGSWLTLGISPLTGITSVVVMGTPSTTHWVDGGIPRRLVLPVTQTAGTLEVRLPTDPNRLPLGYYMLFAMVDDIPSEAVIFRVVEPPTTSVEGEPRSSIRAVSAFPNPFRQVTTIGYSASVPTEIHIDVLDVSGRLVHTLLEGRFEIEGPHAATWDGRNGAGTRLAPGVYFYRLRGGGEIHSGRLVLLP